MTDGYRLGKRSAPSIDHCMVYSSSVTLAGYKIRLQLIAYSSVAAEMMPGCHFVVLLIKEEEITQ